MLIIYSVQSANVALTGCCEKSLKPELFDMKVS